MEYINSEIKMADHKFYVKLNLRSMPLGVYPLVAVMSAFVVGVSYFSARTLLTAPDIALLSNTPNFEKPGFNWSKMWRSTEDYKAYVHQGAYRAAEQKHSV